MKKNFGFIAAVQSSSSRTRKKIQGLTAHSGVAPGAQQRNRSYPQAMEELQDAIEDAQYVTAITSVEDGPRPVVPWEIPDAVQLAEWRERVLVLNAKKKDSSSLPTPFEFEWTLSHALGFFLFSAYLKESVGEYVQINFMEEVLRWKATRGRFRAEKTSFIVANYFSGSATPDSKLGPRDSASPSIKGDENIQPNNEMLSRNKIAPMVEPPKTQIVEYDLAREPTGLSPEEIKEIRARSSGPTETCIGVGGKVLELILNKVDKLRKSPGYASLLKVYDKSDNSNGIGENNLNGTGENGGKVSDRPLPKGRSTMRSLSLVSHELPENLFDEAEIIVAENIRENHWASFQRSEYHTKLLNYLWYQDRTVVEEDFFVIRVLGRGGFGLVNGEIFRIFNFAFYMLMCVTKECPLCYPPSSACKKGTSGKLYAMKVMNKKRIKLKKAEQLTLNERQCLADINSPFVVNLKYSFQSKSDVFLILDLMTGGDLSYHLSQRGRFPKAQCLYYGARIMLGLQALHDQGYVYRDLKPENCLLGEDGRVKLTDLGLATKVTPTLHGAAGTRGYWAPEMLRRGEQGVRMNYGVVVDWFSFGCCLAEFISGTNPFRSQTALNFGLEKGSKTKVNLIVDVG